MSHLKAETSLLSGKKSVFQYNTLSTKEPTHYHDSTELTKISVRRKVKDGSEDVDLEPRSKPATNGSRDPNTVILHEDILPNDTLQSFALRYGCTVNDLKRANGLITEQDFFALRRLKIPVSRYSLLTVPEEKQRHRQEFDKLYSSPPQSSSNSLLDLDLDPVVKSSFETILPSKPVQKVAQPITPPSSEFDSSESLDDAAQLLAIANSRSGKDDANDANKYLKKLDKNIRKTVKKADIRNGSSHNESLNEVLSSIQYFPMEPMAPPSQKRKKTNGADCGLKWWTPIAVFVVILLIIIIMAVFEYNRSED